MFIFAHPDDEFGCFESLRREVESGSKVECYYLTDGGYGGQSIAKRERETMDVLRQLGISNNDVRFLGRENGISDGSLPERMVQAGEMLLRHLTNGVGISAVYAPAWEGGHQDHDAAHVIACVLGAQNLGCRNLKQYSLYHGHGLRGRLFHVLKPLVSNGPCETFIVPLKYRLRYLRFCLSYPSQWMTWVGLFPFVAIKLLFVGRYRLQGAAFPKIFQKPHTGVLLYERRGVARFDDVIKHVNAFVSHHYFGFKD